MNTELTQDEISLSTDKHNHKHAPKGTTEGGRFVGEDVHPFASPEGKAERLRGENIVKGLMPKYEKWMNNLTDGEKDAITRYTGTGHQELNKFLRRNGKLRYVNEDSLQENGIRDEHLPSAMTYLLDSALAKATIPEDLTVYRCIVGTLKKLGNVEVGKVIQDKGFVSTSISSDIAQGYAEDDRGYVVARIMLKKGQKGGLTSERPDDADQEIILPRNSKFNVTAIHKLKHTTLVDLELL